MLGDYSHMRAILQTSVLLVLLLAACAPQQRVQVRTDADAIAVVRKDVL